MLYDSFASIYDRFMAPLESLFLRKWRSEAASLLPENGRILELGAGTGLNFAHYPACQHAVASEISYDMIVRAKARSKSIDLVQADAEWLPFPDHDFDTVFATLVFCSIPNPEVAFKEAQRVTKPGGNVILLEHVRPNGLLGYAFDVLNLATVAMIDDFFNRKTADIAARSGLEIIGVNVKAFGAVNIIHCKTPEN